MLVPPDDIFEEGESVEEEPEGWHPPVRCPQCAGLNTRFTSMQYEMSVYVCELCGLEFEAEE